MNHEEFKQWSKQHIAAFTGIHAWLGRNAKEARIETRDILAAWEDTLADVSLEDAREATRLLHSGEESEPKGYDRHPAAIRAIASRLASDRNQNRKPIRTIDGQRVVQCLECQDVGAIICWHPKSMHAAHPDSEHEREIAKLNGEPPLPAFGEPFTVYTCAVPCKCDAGRIAAERLGVDYRYDASRWMKYQPRADNSHLRDLQDWMRRQHDSAIQWRP